MGAGLLRHPARRRGGGAGQPDEPDRRTAPLSSPTAAPRTPSSRRTCCRHASRRWSTPRRRRACSTPSSPPTATTCERADRPGACPTSSPRRASALHGAGLVAWADMLARGAHAGAADAPAPTTSCVMPYTSGTTGQPKGCMHTHRSVDEHRGRRRAVVRPHAGRGLPVGAAVLPRHRDVGQHERAAVRRRHHRRAAALGPRRRRRLHRSATASPSGRRSRPW